MIVFGGVIEREVHNAFFTLDVRGWTEEQSELPREGWAQIEARLRDKGPEGKPLEDHEDSIKILRQCLPVHQFELGLLSDRH